MGSNKKSQKLFLFVKMEERFTWIFEIVLEGNLSLITE